MLAIRAALFTIIPLLVAAGVPYWIDPTRRPHAGAWAAGWLAVFAGAVIYLMCLLEFMSAGGTPAIFFTRAFRFLIGEEPRTLIQSGLYSRTRNPMYLSVMLAVAGQALAFASVPIALYALLLFVIFHTIVVVIEELHLKAERGAAYEAYTRRVRRWL